MQISCPDNYTFNYHSETCYRIVDIEKSWLEAKQICEQENETLATFETLDSAKWFRRATYVGHGEFSLKTIYIFLGYIQKALIYLFLLFDSYLASSI